MKIVEDSLEVHVQNVGKVGKQHQNQFCLNVTTIPYKKKNIGGIWLSFPVQACFAPL